MSIGIFIPRSKSAREEDFFKAVFRAKEIRDIEGEKYAILVSEAGEMRVSLKAMIDTFVEIFENCSEREAQELEKAVRESIRRKIRKP